MKKILLVATVQSHIAQFHKPLIEMLHEKDCVVDVAAYDNLALKQNLFLTEPDNIYNIGFSRSPFNLKNLKAYKQLKKLIYANDYDIIHCNTPVGGLLTRLAAKKLREKGLKIIYEAHGFHFYKHAPLLNWILYYPIEKCMSKYTDILITINKMDYSLALKKFKAKQVEYIPGVGVNLQQFLTDECRGDIRGELGLDKQCKIILSVGELNKNKNHKVVIRAIAKLNDNKIHYIIAGNGPLLHKLQNLAKKLHVENNVHFLGYRRDLPHIYKSSDVFVLPSYREGLGMAAIEAMCCGLPIITSDRHGINDYSIPEITGYKYAPNDYRRFAKGIKCLLENSELRAKIGEHNKVFANEFSLGASISCLENIYKKVLDNNK